MGVKDLWSVVSPVSEKMSLWELRNETIAIDMSAWVCDSQFANKHQHNMYLRNIFFRTSYLLLNGVKPVFVLEGSAPEVKKNTIMKRMQSQGLKSSNTSRSRLHSLQKQCSELLSYMGVECVQAPGEAEAFCSHLNQLGLVKGIVTQDSDAFLYGAKEVYRNFQLSPHYSCDIYRMDDIDEKLSLSRTHLIAFSLLTGSDYSDGVTGIGKESALKFLRSLPKDDNVFERFKSWKNSSYFSSKINKYSPGNQYEYCVREKVSKLENFPNMEIVNEYLNDPEGIDLDYTWSSPDVPKFISWAVRKLCWEEDYAFDKILPVATRWHLIHGGGISDIFPVQINKKRNIRGIKSFEILWKSDLFKNENITTTEDENLVVKAYPLLVEEFFAKKKKPEKLTLKKKRKKGDGNVDNTRTIDEVHSPLAKNRSIANQKFKQIDLRESLLRKTIDSTSVHKNILNEVLPLSETTRHNIISDNSKTVERFAKWENVEEETVYDLIDSSNCGLNKNDLKTDNSIQNDDFVHNDDNFYVNNFVQTDSTLVLDNVIRDENNFDVDSSDEFNKSMNDTIASFENLSFAYSESEFDLSTIVSNIVSRPCASSLNDMSLMKNAHTNVKK